MWKITRCKCGKACAGLAQLGCRSSPPRLAQPAAAHQHRHRRTSALGLGQSHLLRRTTTTSQPKAMHGLGLGYNAMREAVPHKNASPAQSQGISGISISGMSCRGSVRTKPQVLSPCHPPRAPSDPRPPHLVGSPPPGTRHGQGHDKTAQGALKAN
jgi:hypothetical protein